MSEVSAKNHLKWILPLLILLLAALGAVVLVKLREEPAKMAQTNPGLLVETVSLVRQSERAIVHATGSVEPLREISVVAEVNGKLIWVSPRFVEGGFFRKGESLLEIDPRDYHLRIQMAEAELARARTGLQTEEEQSAIAQREWDQLELSDKGTPGPLVLRQPQLDSANAALAAARANLELARLNIERTRIIAPFAGRIRSKKVDQGEYIRSGNSLAIFAGTDQAEIVVPLSLADLRWLDIPTAGSGKKGSNCTISAQIDGHSYRWQGAISRTFGEIDHGSRMAKIAIVVDDPYNLSTEGPEYAIPLNNGLFVDIEIEGASLGEVVKIPRNALREGDTVWLVTEDNRLEIRPVDVLRRQRRSLLIAEGLRGGERLILTNISGAAPRMKLRPRQREKQ
jgi:RND family efflux transporter MFP subunit